MGYTIATEHLLRLFLLQYYWAKGNGSQSFADLKFTGIKWYFLETVSITINHHPKVIMFSERMISLPGWKHLKEQDINNLPYGESTRVACSELLWSTYVLSGRAVPPKGVDDSLIFKWCSARRVSGGLLRVYREGVVRGSEGGIEGHLNGSGGGGIFWAGLSQPLSFSPPEPEVSFVLHTWFQHTILSAKIFLLLKIMKTLWDFPGSPVG